MEIGGRRINKLNFTHKRFNGLTDLTLFSFVPYT